MNLANPNMNMINMKGSTNHAANHINASAMSNIKHTAANENINSIKVKPPFLFIFYYTSVFIDYVLGCIVYQQDHSLYGGQIVP